MPNYGDMILEGEIFGVNFYRAFLLNLNSFVTNQNFFRAANSVFQQASGLPMGSYHRRQIANLAMLLSEFNYFNTPNTNGMFIFCRCIDDGLLLTNKANLNHIITNLCNCYQIPITFTSNHNHGHYLDLNHYIMSYHRIHY